MKSIRRSLIVNVLVLLAVVLTLVGVLIDRLAQQTLLSRQQSAVELREQQYDDQVRETIDKRDQAMLTQARTLAGMTQSQVQWQRLRLLSLAPLGILTASLMPNAHVQTPVMIAMGSRGPLSGRLFRIVGTELQLSEDFLPRDAENEHREFYQVTTEFGQSWRSRSLGNLSLPTEIPAMQRGSLFDWRFDEIQLLDGLTVHRVMLKAPLTRVRYLWPGRGPGPGPGPGPQSMPPPPQMISARPDRNEGPPKPRGNGPPPDRVSEGYLPTILVQCAWETASLDAQIAEMTERRDADLHNIAEITNSTLNRLRFRFLIIGLSAFLMLTIGGWSLIGFGLVPLKRLSDAVSQVTERDFRLPIDGSPLPGELQPIADRMISMLDQLRQAFEREKQATADISHELRTPVAALMTTLDVTLRKPRSETQYREALQDCRLITRQLSGLVERVMTLACLDAGTVRFRPFEVDLIPVVESCAVMIRPLVEANGLTLKVSHPRELTLVTDVDKLREVMMNLLHNAVEYNRPGGEICFTAELVGEQLRIEVRDTGIGIDREMLPRIFERFYRSDPSRQATGIHAGLGLSIVQEYVHRLGGRILVESQPDQGSRFCVLVPISLISPLTPRPGETP